MMASALPSDAYSQFDRIPEAERSVLLELRGHLERDVHPLLADHWERGTFPDQIVPPLATRRLMDPPALEAEPSALYHRWRNFELARVDASVATFYNAVSGLFRTAILEGGSPEQVAAWDPLVRRWELTGAFALTEPDHGSDIARGLMTSCRRDGADWIIDGSKRWIGGAGQLGHLLVVAREEKGAFRAFIVDREALGVSLRKINGKTSLRIMQNYDVTLSGVRVSDDRRLARIETFADVAACLRRMRADVAWIATGTAAGAYEAALRYTLSRTQFGRPIAGFQLVQEKLARMLANVTASLSLVMAFHHREQQSVVSDQDSALAKMFTAERLRETVALAREVCGGNGITLATDVARFHADAEAIYSYEGTHEINALIVGRGATGISAFT